MSSAAAAVDPNEVHISGLRLSGVPSIVYYMVPGNPGLTSIHQPWLSHLSDQLGPKCLMCVASHLGKHGHKAGTEA